MAAKTVLILGAGIGGIVTARELRRHLGNEHRIVLVDRDAVHSFPPSFLWVMIGWREPAAIQRPLALLKRHGIDVRQAEVRAIDCANRNVETSAGAIAFDYLVVALGAELSPSAVPGLADHAASFYTLNDTLALRETISRFRGGEIAITVSALPFKCPPAPYEAALLLESFFRRKGCGARISIHTPEPSPIAAAGPLAGEAVAELCAQRGIALHTGRRAASVRAGEVAFEDGSSAPSDLTIAVAPHRAASAAAALADESGWIPVDPHTLRTTVPGVYAIGDITSVRSPAGLPLPKVGVFAHNEGEIVAQRIAYELRGSSRWGSPKEFDGAGFCFLETGNGRAGYLSGNFYSSPHPAVAFHEPSVTYHWGKVTFEKYWLWRWF